MLILLKPKPIIMSTQKYAEHNNIWIFESQFLALEAILGLQNNIIHLLSSNINLLIPLLNFLRTKKKKKNFRKPP